MACDRFSASSTRSELGCFAFADRRTFLFDAFFFAVLGTGASFQLGEPIE
jgi:hypothetical protein